MYYINQIISQIESVSDPAELGRMVISIQRMKREVEKSKGTVEKKKIANHELNTLLTTIKEHYGVING